MALAILDIAFQTGRCLAPGSRCIRETLGEGRIGSKGGVHAPTDLLDNFDVGQLLPTADIIDLARPALGDTEFDAPAMILDMQPVAHVHAVAVDGQLAAVQCVQQEERDQLLWKLKGPVIVRAIAGRRLQPVGVVVGAHQMIGASLGRGIRRIWRVGRGLAEGRVVRPQRTVYLVGRDVVEAVGLARALVEPGILGRLQQAVRADDVGGHERVRTRDRSVDMALGGEVDDRVDVPAVDQFGDEIGVADVADDELHAVQPVEIGAVARIGQRVEHDDAVLGMGLAPMMHEVRADEAGAAGDDQISHGSGFHSA